MGIGLGPRLFSVRVSTRGLGVSCNPISLCAASLPVDTPATGNLVGASPDRGTA